MLKRLMGTNNDVSFTILRIVLGVVFFAHGAQKMLGWFGGFGFHGTMGAFTHMGLPAPVALLIIGVSGPVILARAAARHGTSAVAASVPSELVVLLICWGLNSWLGHRIASRVTS